MFFKGSRYENVSDEMWVDRSGREIVYKRLRFTPSVAAFRAHIVAPDDRLDRIANQYYADAEQFWRIADGNEALRPEALTDEVGRRLRVPLS